LKITPDGLVHALPIPAQDGVARAVDEPSCGWPHGGMTFGADGAIYFYDGRANAIRRLSPDGVISTIVTGPPAHYPN
jgi:hypothetical protein